MIVPMKKIDKLYNRIYVEISLILYRKSQHGLAPAKCQDIVEFWKELASSVEALGRSDSYW
jgi:hypothetical protein